MVALAPERDAGLKTRVRALRQAKFWTQAELAEKAGVSKLTIVRIENEQGEPEYRTLRAVAAALGVEPSELIIK